jgi:protoporphyrinogen oxidase
VYWLNVNDRSFPFLSMVAHTNFIDKKYYGGNHITYFGNYLPDGHPYLKMNKEQLFKLFTPYIQKINPKFNKLKTDSRQLKAYLFTVSNAQPVHTLHYSRQAPNIETPIQGIYLANMDSIYPWDRGTNYAVELGEKAAKIISKK